MPGVSYEGNRVAQLRLRSAVWEPSGFAGPPTGPASIVLDVPEQATKLHFGALLSGAGVMNLTRPRFDEVGEAIPVTATVAPLPDEPQALDFSKAP